MWSLYVAPPSLASHSWFIMTISYTRPMAMTLDAQAGGRRGILFALKKRGQARADELAAHLGITPSAVRQHLTGLLADGLVTFEEQRGGPGRPKHVYRLTPTADALFPRTYSD